MTSESPKIPPPTPPEKETEAREKEGAGVLAQLTKMEGRVFARGEIRDRQIVAESPEAATEIAGEVLLEMMARFNPEQARSIKEMMIYHVGEHPKDVVRNATKTLEAIAAIDPDLVAEELTPFIYPADISTSSLATIPTELRVKTPLGKILRTDPLIQGVLQLAAIASYGHDVDQEGKLMESGFRQRDRGYTPMEGEPVVEDAPPGKRGNEQKSAENVFVLLQRCMQKDAQSGTLIPIFPTADRRFEMLVKSAIGATFPDPKFEQPLSNTDLALVQKEGEDLALLRDQYGKGLRMLQPYASPELSVFSLVLSNADLRGAVGAGRSEDYEDWGDREWLEFNYKMVALLQKSFATLSPEEKLGILENRMRWLPSQVGFALFQRKDFLQSLEEHIRLNQSAKAAEIKTAIREIYRHFEENARAARMRYEDAQGEFDQLGKTPDDRLAAVSGMDEDQFWRLLRMDRKHFARLIGAPRPLE